jgi:hypothetical protein
VSETSIPSVVFDSPGAHNTTRTLQIAAERARQLGIRTILVATTEGDTALEAVESLNDAELVIVTHAWGFSGPNTQQLSEERRQALEAAGATVLTCQHALGGVGRAVRKKFDTYELDEIVAHTLRLFGQGMKVCVEIALMAADAGLVRAGEPCICVAGTGRGADTAVTLIPAHVSDFFDLKIQEILAKPRLG